MLYDVAVIGGGPIGSRVACRLSQSGHKVIVLEKKLRCGEPVCCTGIVSRECADTFNIDRNIIRHYVDSARLFSPSGQMLHIHRPGIQICILDRAALDKEMAKRAQEAGAAYYYGSRVHNIEVSRDTVFLTGSNNGANLDIKSRSVVIAAGLGTKFPDAPIPMSVSDFAMGIQAEVETNDINEIEVYFDRCIAPGFFAWLVPILPHKALIGLISYRDAGNRLKKLLALLVEQGKIKSADVIALHRALPFHPLPKTYSRRLLVVGSTAGQVKPLTGGGIYYGLLCADIAADTLHQALVTDDLAAKSLESYERNWHQRLGDEIRSSYRGKKILKYLTNKQLDRIFAIAQTNNYVESLLKMEELSFDWHSKILKSLFREKLWSGIRDLITSPFFR